MSSRLVKSLDWTIVKEHVTELTAWIIKPLKARGQHLFFHTAASTVTLKTDRDGRDFETHILWLFCILYFVGVLRHFILKLDTFLSPGLNCRKWLHKNWLKHSLWLNTTESRVLSDPAMHSLSATEFHLCSSLSVTAGKKLVYYLVQISPQIKACFIKIWSAVEFYGKLNKWH